MLCINFAIPLGELGNEIVAAVGMKVSNRGEWIRHKWTVERWIKVHVAVDIKTKITIVRKNRLRKM